MCQQLPNNTRYLRQGRVNQKLRTRQALLDAAGELLAEGATPSLVQIADRARVSRATAYRYFPSVDALIEESFFEREFPDENAVFGERSSSLHERASAVERAVNDLMFGNEPAVHVVVRNIIDTWIREGEGKTPHRPGRRVQLIDAALAPFVDSVGSEELRMLRNALCLAIGTEAVLALRDVCGLSLKESRLVTRWVVDTLVKATLSA